MNITLEEFKKLLPILNICIMRIACDQCEEDYTMLTGELYIEELYKQVINELQNENS